jgi:predicted transcriptional regulator
MITKPVTDDNKSFNLHLSIFSVEIEDMMVLTREEKERRVIDLYNQGRTYREIAKEARISPRDIGHILRKIEQNSQRQQQEDSGKNNGRAAEPLDKTTQAYRLFSKGKKPIEVAIELGLDRTETIRLYRDVWKLKRLYTLNNVYEEIGEEIRTFLKLYKIVKNQGMLGNLEGFVTVLKSAAYDIPALQRQIERLKNEVQSIQYQKQEYIIEVQKQSNRIVDLKRLEQSHTEACSRLQQDMRYHINEKEQIIASVEGFKRSNKNYRKIKGIAEEHINNFLSDQKILVSAAVHAAIEALRIHPNKHRIICSNDGDYDGESNTISDHSITVLSELESNYSYDDNEVGDVAIVSDTANTLYDRIREWLVDKTITSVIQMEQERKRN